MLPKDQDPKTRLVKSSLCTNNFSDKVGIYSILRKKIIETRVYKNWRHNCKCKIVESSKMCFTIKCDSSCNVVLDNQVLVLKPLKSQLQNLGLAV